MVRFLPEVEDYLENLIVYILLKRRFLNSPAVRQTGLSVDKQACLLTNRAALHPPKADAGGQRPRHSCEPVQTEVSYAGIYK